MNLRADADVPLTDQDTGVVNGLCETQLEYLCLQSPLQKVFDFEGKDVIQFHAGFIKHTNSDETADKGIALEETTGILFYSISTQIQKHTVKDRI
jgi:hypothetical protein